MKDSARFAAAIAVMAAGLGLVGSGAANEAQAQPGPLPQWCPGDLWDPGWGPNSDWKRCHDDPVQTVPQPLPGRGAQGYHPGGPDHPADLVGRADLVTRADLVGRADLVDQAEVDPAEDLADPAAADPAEDLADPAAAASVAAAAEAAAEAAADAAAAADSSLLAAIAPSSAGCLSC
jgi:hypothetical protein